eukprot:SAG31_NODE_800_length_12014_cov_11.050608_4_plen_51_part_00
MQTYTISCNVFFGDNSSDGSAYIGKILRPPILPAFTYWLTNIIEQVRPLA